MEVVRVEHIGMGVVDDTMEGGGVLVGLGVQVLV